MKLIPFLLLACAISTHAQLVTLVSRYGDTPAMLELDSWQSAELVSMSPMISETAIIRIEKNDLNIYHYLSPNTWRPLIVVGPARIVPLATFSSLHTMATFRLTPEPYPPTQAMIVPPGTGGATVTLECSTNLINWFAATNGVYTNLPVAKFFRVKLDKIP